MSGTDPDADGSLAPPSPDPRDPRTWPAAGAAVVLVGCLGFVAGLPGALAGLATAVVLYGLGTPYALAVGHVALVALFPDGIDPVSLAVTEVGFVAILLADADRVSRLLAFAGVALAGALALGGLAWLLARAQPLWLAATGQLVALAIVAYGIHRYERVRLGLIDPAPDERPTTRRSDP